MKSLNIGFIGSGFIARFLAKAMKQVRHVELSAIYKRSNAESLSKYAHDNYLGNPRICSTIKEVCQYCDAIAILTPNHTRVPVMEEIAEAVHAGVRLKGLICEKPLGRTIEEATRLVELAKSASLPTAYFEDQIYMRAINNGLNQLAPQIESMGPVTLARSTEEHSGPHNAWFWDPVKQGGGALSDMACHSIAGCRYLLTPPGKSHSFLQPVSVQADVSLLKWGQPRYRDELKQRFGIDYAETPAEDYCTGTVTFKNPDTDQLVKAQFSDSWMFDKQGLRLTMEALGPGYAMEVNTLRSPLEVFIGDAAAEAATDPEDALEKSTASRGLLAVQPNEADLYGYVDELVDMRNSFWAGNDALLNWQYGLETTWLCQAAYMSAEQGNKIDLTNQQTIKQLEQYKSLIAQGKGAEVLFV